MVTIRITKEPHWYAIFDTQDDSVFAQGETIEEALFNFFDVREQIYHVRNERMKKKITNKRYVAKLLPTREFTNIELVLGCDY